MRFRPTTDEANGQHDEEDCEPEPHTRHLRDHLTPWLTAARRPQCEPKLLYPDHLPSSGLPEADGAAGAVEPVVRCRQCHLWNQTIRSPGWCRRCVD